MDESIIGDCILALENALDTDAEFRASFDPKRKTFLLECFSKDSPEMERFYEKVFWNAPQYFPLDPSWTYSFRMTTHKDIGTSVEMAVFAIAIETNVGLMPGRSGVSAEGWKRFTDQLIYTVNGKRYDIEAPDFLPFL
ncbi:MAG: hypothetical protein MJ234_02230 [bacterium]|nr:hypothetical protein [bacterium]